MHLTTLCSHACDQYVNVLLRLTVCLAKLTMQLRPHLNIYTPARDIEWMHCAWKKATTEKERKQKINQLPEMLLWRPPARPSGVGGEWWGWRWRVMDLIATSRMHGQRVCTVAWARPGSTRVHSPAVPTNESLMGILSSDTTINCLWAKGRQFEPRVWHVCTSWPERVRASIGCLCACCFFFCFSFFFPSYICIMLSWANLRHVFLILASFICLTEFFFFFFCMFLTDLQQNSFQLYFKVPSSIWHCVTSDSNTVPN